MAATFIVPLFFTHGRSTPTAFKGVFPGLDDLFYQACPSSRDEVFYPQQMQVAARRRLPFNEALHFVIERHHEAELMSRYRATQKRIG